MRVREFSNTKTRNQLIGYSAIIPVIFAKARNQPFVIIDTLDYEYGTPSKQDTWIVASKRSNIHSLTDLRGKTVAINATGALCELLVKDHLAKAGVPYDDVKKIIVPMPQMASMLQVGNADAACISEPFYAAARLSPNVQAVTLASGVVANLQPDQRIALDVLFAREDWVKQHHDVLARFNKVLEKATVRSSADISPAADDASTYSTSLLMIRSVLTRLPSLSTYRPSRL